LAFIAAGTWERAGRGTQGLFRTTTNWARRFLRARPAVTGARLMSRSHRRRTGLAANGQVENRGSTCAKALLSWRLNVQKSPGGSRRAFWRGFPSSLPQPIRARKEMRGRLAEWWRARLRCRHGEDLRIGRDRTFGPTLERRVGYRSGQMSGAFGGARARAGRWCPKE